MLKKPPQTPIFDKVAQVYFPAPAQPCAHPLLNRYSTGAPEGRQQTSPNRNEAGPDKKTKPAGTEE